MIKIKYRTVIRSLYVQINQGIFVNYKKKIVRNYLKIT